MAEIEQPTDPSLLSAVAQANERSLVAESQANADAQVVPQMSTAEHYPNRYFEGDYVILSLGPKPYLFRVQRNILAKYSGTFRDMFSLPPPEGGTAEGSSDDNPIRLPDDPDHFAGVLSVYHGTVLMPYPCDLSFDYVTSVLRVASKYEFTLAVEWAWSKLSETWSWRARPWLAALPQPSRVNLRQAIALIGVSRELDDRRLLGSAFYMLCVDQKWSGEESVYGAMQPADVFLLLKITRKISRLWVEKCAAQAVSSALQPVNSTQGWLAFIQDLSTITAIHHDMGLPFP
ncbi:hypothetical protein BOTBODRAFT_69061 [Botryobasidium botryosum FD-172 SS1]|uniref:BTB domain-containing protein n=1 Tax=Botryobasidium botryosum (strain FD-172 SS1) TaxID=930990 RepID=A0A067MD40_BOTB1|nr:hypothetical protein BOTBODRAFT_69061 [Botryobasidium botryosum FD-172 SS1]